MFVSARSAQTLQYQFIFTHTHSNHRPAGAEFSSGLCSVTFFWTTYPLLNLSLWPAHLWGSENFQMNVQEKQTGRHMLAPFEGKSREGVKLPEKFHASCSVEQTVDKCANYWALRVFVLHEQPTKLETKCTVGSFKRWQPPHPHPSPKAVHVYINLKLQSLSGTLFFHIHQRPFRGICVF